MKEALAEYLDKKTFVYIYFYCISGYVPVVINFAFFANRIFSQNLKHAKFKLNTNSTRKSPYSRSKKHAKFIF